MQNKKLENFNTRLKTLFYLLKKHAWTNRLPLSFKLQKSFLRFLEFFAFLFLLLFKTDYNKVSRVQAWRVFTFQSCM